MLRHRFDKCDWYSYDNIDFGHFLSLPFAGIICSLLGAWEPHRQPLRYMFITPQYRENNDDMLELKTALHLIVPASRAFYLLLRGMPHFHLQVKPHTKEHTSTQRRSLDNGFSVGPQRLLFRWEGHKSKLPSNAMAALMAFIRHFRRHAYTHSLFALRLFMLDDASPFSTAGLFLRYILMLFYAISISPRYRVNVSAPLVISLMPPPVLKLRSSTLYDTFH